MNLNWAWICFFLIKLFTEHVRQHLVNSNISQEDIIISQKLSFIFKLMEITLQSIETNNFSDTWNFKICNLCSKFWFWVLNEDANSRIMLRRIKWLWHLNLQRSWCLSHWNLPKSKAQMNITIFFSQQLLFFISSVFLLEIILECFYSWNYLFWFNTLFNLSSHFFNSWFHCLLVFFF